MGIRIGPLFNAIFAVLLLITASLPVAAVRADHQSDRIQFTGTAYDPESKNVLYTEHHDIVLDEGGDYLKSSVLYKDPKRQVIATKDLVFGDVETMPELLFKDYRTLTEFETNNILSPQSKQVLLRANQGQGDTQTTVSGDPAATLVTDAGFDLLVMKNWERLVSGNAFEFEFLALTRASYYTFRLAPLKAASGKDKSKTLRLVLEPASFLIRLLVDPIYLTYDLESKRLLQFEGLTNIEEVIDGRITGKNYIARIEYEYKETH